MGYTENLVLSTMSEDAFVLTNKKLIRFLKGDGSAAILLCELISAHKYHVNNDTLEPDGAFESPSRRWIYGLGMSVPKQHRILTDMAEAGLISVSLRGFPKKRYVAINFDTVAKVLAADSIEIKKAEKKTFYEKLNNGLTLALQPDTGDPTEQINAACDNIKGVPKGTIVLLSQDWIRRHPNQPLRWDGPIVGHLINWCSRRAYDKTFDYTLITRTLASLPSKAGFRDHIWFFLSTCKTTPEVHFSEQVYDYTELLLNVKRSVDVKN